MTRLWRTARFVVMARVVARLWRTLRVVAMAMVFVTNVPGRATWMSLVGTILRLKWAVQIKRELKYLQVRGSHLQFAGVCHLTSGDADRKEEQDQEQSFHRGLAPTEWSESPDSLAAAEAFSRLRRFVRSSARTSVVASAAISPTP